MNAVLAPDHPKAVDARFEAPYDHLDDAALLVHFRRRPQIRFTPVIDAEEIAPARLDGILEGRFEFNGETHALPDPVDWLANPSADVEWHILLHKFYYAVGLAQRWQRSGDRACAQRWAVLVDGWLRQVPVGFIAADVTGRRVQNWLGSLHALVFEGRDGEPAPIAGALLRRVLHSLHDQVEFLCANLTPKRNHRTLELLAVFMAGVLLPELRGAARWRRFALEQTAANVEADLLPDGVHCELSTDYHHLALRNWLQVRTLAADHGVPVPPVMDRALEDALEFSLHVHQPSGVVPSFSDGDARDYRALLALGARLYGREDMRWVATSGREGRPPADAAAHFDASGYHVLRSGWPAAPQHADAQHLVFDCGPLGEGNHGHFDALSFELHAHGRPLVVDPGRYTYSEAGATNWRLHFRGTAAHNTVCVDGLNQTRYEPRAVKDASRHAHGSVRHRIAGPAPDCTLVERAHGEGLDLLHGRCASHAYDVVHERCIVFVDRRWWIVADTLRSDSEHDCALGFQLAPAAEGACRLERGVLSSPGLTLVQPERPGHRIALEPAWVSARYGRKAPAPRLVTRARGRDVDFDSVLVPWARGELQPRVTLHALSGVDGSAASTLAVAWPDTARVDRWLHARGARDRWPVGGATFEGRWLFWREDAAGRVVQAVSHAGARLDGVADGLLHCVAACE